MSSLKQQIGGGHYKDLAIQPVEYIHKNHLGFIEGSCIKYLTRWRNKNGVEDLKKARHFLDLLIEMEEAARDDTLAEIEAEDFRMDIIARNGNDGLHYQEIAKYEDDFEE